MSLQITGDAVIAQLRSADLLVGDAIAPRGGGWTGPAGNSSFNGYCILYPTGGGGVDGPLGRPREVVTTVFQVTCVGATRQQTDFLRDRVRDALFSKTFSVPDHTVLNVTLDMPIATIRDDDFQPPTYYSADRFRIKTQPLGVKA